MTADGQVAVVWKRGGFPGGEALGIAVVAALRLSRVADQGTVIVHLFAGVVLVHVEAVAHDFVGGVLDGIEAAGFGVFGDADGVAKTPATQTSESVLFVGDRDGVFKIGLRRRKVLLLARHDLAIQF